MTELSSQDVGRFLKALQDIGFQIGRVADTLVEAQRANTSTLLDALNDLGLDDELRSDFNSANESETIQLSVKPDDVERIRAAGIDHKIIDSQRQALGLSKQDTTSESVASDQLMSAMKTKDHSRIADILATFPQLDAWRSMPNAQRRALGLPEIDIP